MIEYLPSIFVFLLIFLIGLG
ncbi:MAG: hypothetical protein ACW991_03890 [Candidatus Hodarchaeales archaeon]